MRTGMFFATRRQESCSGAAPWAPKVGQFPDASLNDSCGHQAQAAATIARIPAVSNAGRTSVQIWISVDAEAGSEDRRRVIGSTGGRASEVIPARGRADEGRQ